MGDIEVRVIPRAQRDEIAGERDGRMVVRVTAAPVEGAANAALRRLLAKRVGVARGRVSVVRGGSSRDKLVRVEGVSGPKLRAALTREPG